MRGEFIDLAGERLYYYAAGSRGAGEPIVLIHGFPTSGHLWLDVVAKLPPGHRVIVVDLLGFGRSDSRLTSSYTVAAHGARVLALMDALRVDRACLVGHGVGGVVAARVAVHSADRVCRVAVFDTRSCDPWFTFQRGLGSRLAALLLRVPASLSIPVLCKSIARGYDDPERGARSAELYLRPFMSGHGPALLRRHLSHLAGLAEENGAPGLEQLTIPNVVRKELRPYRPEETPSDVAADIRCLLSAR